MKFFEELIKRYAQIKFPEEYSEVVKADKTISWYMADSTDQYLSIERKHNVNIVEIDIRQAFTNICRCLFEPTSDFIIQMNNIVDKKSRNIFIATSLVDSEYLHLLNIISKIIIIGIIFDIGNISLIELKKDGVIIICDDDTLSKFININEETSYEFINFVKEHNFIFHTYQYERYIRSNRTSYFLRGTEFIVKGMFKHAPPYIRQLQKEILHNNFENFKKILKIYSKQYLNILLINNLTELLNEYYLCSNKKYLSEDSKYVSHPSTIIPRTYIKSFLYPIILSTKL